MARLLFLALILSSTPSAGVAQKQAAPNHNVGDPNERVCEKLTVVGSRLAVKTVCATRAEWADKKRQDREVIQQAQQARHCQAKSTGGFGEGTTC